MTDEQMNLLETYLQIALGALADIAFSDDMSLELAQKKAKRIYEEINAERQTENRP